MAKGVAGEMALVVLERGLYNDRLNQAHWMDPGNAFVTTVPYAMKLISLGFCKPFTNPDDTVLDADVPEGDGSAEASPGGFGPGSPRSVETSAAITVEMAEMLEAVGIPVKTIRRMQVHGIDNMATLELWVVEKPEALRDEIPGLGPVMLKKIQALFY